SGPQAGVQLVPAEPIPASAPVALALDTPHGQFHASATDSSLAAAAQPPAGGPKAPEGEVRTETSSANVSPVKLEPVSVKVPVNGHDTEASGSVRDDCSSSSASEAEKPAVSRKTRVSRKRGAAGRDKAGPKRQRANSESNSDAAPEEASPKKEEKQETISRRRGRRPKGTKQEPAEEVAAVPRKKQ
ncbi:conserved hypothetical protein, partial [Ixodes scapularis]